MARFWSARFLSLRETVVDLDEATVVVVGWWWEGDRGVMIKVRRPSCV